MIHLRIWWANLWHAVYEWTHEKRDYHDVFQRMIKETPRWEGCYPINGHFYRDTWQGRIHADICRCFLDKEVEA